MGKRSAPQRPMKGFSKIVFRDDGEAVAAGCPVCGKSACFCTRDLEAGVSPVQFNLVKPTASSSEARPAGEMGTTSGVDTAMKSDGHGEKAARKAAKIAKKVAASAAAAAAAAAAAVAAATADSTASEELNITARKAKAAAKQASRAAVDCAEAAAGGKAVSEDKAARKAARKAAKAVARQVGGCAATEALHGRATDEVTAAPPAKKVKRSGGHVRGSAEAEASCGADAPSVAVAVAVAVAVTELRSAEEWEAMLSMTSAAQPVVVDFSAPWCAPCAAIAPFFAELAGRYAVGLQ